MRFTNYKTFGQEAVLTNSKKKKKILAQFHASDYKIFTFIPSGLLLAGLVPPCHCIAQTHTPQDHVAIISNKFENITVSVTAGDKLRS